MTPVRERDDKERQHQIAVLRARIANLDREMKPMREQMHRMRRELDSLVVQRGTIWTIDREGWEKWQQTKDATTDHS